MSLTTPMRCASSRNATEIRTASWTRTKCTSSSRCNTTHTPQAAPRTNALRRAGRLRVRRHAGRRGARHGAPGGRRAGVDARRLRRHHDVGPVSRVQGRLRLVVDRAGQRRRIPPPRRPLPPAALLLHGVRRRGPQRGAHLEGGRGRPGPGAAAGPQCRYPGLSLPRTPMVRLFRTAA